MNVEHYVNIYWHNTCHKIKIKTFRPQDLLHGFPCGSNTIKTTLHKPALTLSVSLGKTYLDMHAEYAESQQHGAVDDVHEHLWAVEAGWWFSFLLFLSNLP